MIAQKPVLNTCMKATVRCLLTNHHRRKKNMENWDRLIRHKPYITDLGKNCTMEFHMIHAVVGRYIVWLPMAELTGTSPLKKETNLEELMKKYDIHLNVSSGSALL